MKIIGITQARSASTRFPKKIFATIQGESLLKIHIRRALMSEMMDSFIVATTTETQDDAILEHLEGFNIPIFRGSEQDVLDRFYRAALPYQPDYIVRLTSDCPLIDGALIDKVIRFTIEKNLDYCSNALETNYPNGQDIEVFKFSALEKAWKEAVLASEREHVTPYIWKNSSFKGGHLFVSDNFSEGYHYGHQRITVDKIEDFKVIEVLIERIGWQSDWLTYAQILEQSPDIQELNTNSRRNEGYEKSLKEDKIIEKSSSNVFPLENPILVSVESLSLELLERLTGLGVGVELAYFAYPWNLENPNLAEKIKEYALLLKNFEGLKTMHGAFYDLNMTSRDPKILEVAHFRIQESIRIAEALGVQHLVFHPNYQHSKHPNYLNYWVEKQIAFWNRFVPELTEKKIHIYLENTRENSPIYIKKIIDGIDSPFVKICYDTGHSHCFTESKIAPIHWANEYGDALRYVHLHSNHGELDEHIAFTKGTVDFTDFFEKIKASNPPIWIVIEVKYKEDFIISLQALRKW